MYPQGSREILEQLQAQQAELTDVRRQIASLQQGRRRPARWQRVLPLTFLVALLALAPLGVFGASFIDLNLGSVHNGNINAIADAGISKGCTDASHYCPNDVVTREQMASFLARTAGIGGNPPVTNAAKLQGYAPNALLRVESSKKTVFTNLTTDYLHEVTLYIVAPEPGYMLLIGSISFDKFNAGSCDVQTQIIPVGAMATDVPTFYTRLGTDAGASTQASVSANVVYPVVSGTLPFTLQSKILATCGTAPRALDAHLSAIFIPFNGGGTTP